MGKGLQKQEGPNTRHITFSIITGSHCRRRNAIVDMIADNFYIFINENICFLLWKPFDVVVLTVLTERTIVLLFDPSQSWADFSGLIYVLSIWWTLSKPPRRTKQQCPDVRIVMPLIMSLLQNDGVMPWRMHGGVMSLYGIFIFPLELESVYGLYNDAYFQIFKMCF